jgi:hypothetical protein
MAAIARPCGIVRKRQHPPFEGGNSQYSESPIRFILDLSLAARIFLSTLVYRRRQAAAKARETAIFASMAVLSRGFW